MRIIQEREVSNCEPPKQSKTLRAKIGELIRRLATDEMTWGQAKAERDRHLEYQEQSVSSVKHET